MKIKAHIKTELTLKGKFEEFKLEHEGFDLGYSCYGTTLKDFLKELDEKCKGLFFDIDVYREFNRKDKLSSFSRGINYRKKDIKFKDIEFDIGVKAEKYIEKELGMTLKECIAMKLSTQRYSTKEEDKAVIRYLFLKNEINTLKGLVNGRSLDYMESKKYKNTSYLQTKTFKLSFDEYNTKLKLIEDEIKSLCSQHSFLKYDEYDFKYKKKPMNFEDWKKKNEEDVKEEYDDNNEYLDEDDERVPFDEFLLNAFNHYVESLNDRGCY
jgi:hypothetical protein|tara:strand:- start:40290 stop:41090 length:801 start_codon:yes stop_codon:yes gene_type:complete